MVSPQLYRRAIPAAARISLWTAPDGWQLRRFDWPAEGHPRGSILFQGGAATSSRNIWRRSRTGMARAGRSPRSTGAGRADRGGSSPDQHVGHVETFDTFVDDFAAFWADMVARKRWGRRW